MDTVFYQQTFSHNISSFGWPFKFDLMQNWAIFCVYFIPLFNAFDEYEFYFFLLLNRLHKEINTSAFRTWAEVSKSLLNISSS